MRALWRPCCDVRLRIPAILCTRLRLQLHAQEMLVSRSSDTLKALAELDAAELRRHRQNTLLWEVSTTL